MLELMHLGQTNSLIAWYNEVHDYYFPEIFTKTTNSEKLVLEIDKSCRAYSIDTFSSWVRGWMSSFWMLMVAISEILELSATQWYQDGIWRQGHRWYPSRGRIRHTLHSVTFWNVHFDHTFVFVTLPKNDIRCSFSSRFSPLLGGVTRWRCWRSAKPFLHGRENRKQE
jgi:hypothetical protein